MTIEQGWENADDAQDQGAPTWFPQPIPVKIVEALTENVAPESTSWLVFPIAAAPQLSGGGSNQPTQLCPHRYHRYKAKFVCNIPGGYTVYVSRVVDYLMSGALANQFQLINGQNLPDYDGQQALYAVYANTGVAQPAGGTPATGVPVQNTNAFPVNAVIGANGATITSVSVNGVVVGTAAGTYTVPAFGSISISYTVATPTLSFTSTGGVPTISVMDEGFKEVQ
jgi:hypothetical protein